MKSGNWIDIFYCIAIILAIIAAFVLEIRNRH